MLTVDNTDVFGWEAAIRGMRNPLNSWDKSDSGLQVMNPGDVEVGYEPIREYIVGENDLKLMQTLSKAGSDHAKFVRMINVTVDITAPLYWWKEFDTYKVGTVANSCSTMHKIHEKEFTLDDFSHEHLISDFNDKDSQCTWIQEPTKMSFFATPLDGLEMTIRVLNANRWAYLKTKDIRYWWQMIQLLPSSYNQKRTVQLNYQVLKNMYFARRNHKLDEWHTLCDWMLTLPYFKEICVEVHENV